MEEIFYLTSNQLCDEVPTEVSSLSSSVDSEWKIQAGNMLGTPLRRGWAGPAGERRTF